MQVILVCWNCLAKGDGIKQCQSVTCRADGCKKHNHSLLNETKKLIASQPIMEKVAQNNNIQSTGNQPKRYLQVLPVILSDDSYSLRTNALLGSGAGQIESKLVNFTISSNHHLRKMQTTKAWPIPNLPTPHTNRFRSDKIIVSKFYNFVKPSSSENTNHQSMVNSKLVDSTH